MTAPVLHLDLRRPPRQRWQFDDRQREQARLLLQVYVRDLGLDRDRRELLLELAPQVLPPDHAEELQGIADQLQLPLADVLLGNLYYDLLKVVIGCTAFAVDAGDSVLHARNLDWWSVNDQLTKHTAVVRCTGAPAGDYTMIGWPGFAGVFSAVAAGRFAVTLNSVLSFDPVQLGTPVVFLLRTVLETAPDFDAALQVLAATPIPCDCLLLLSGVRPGEMAVIERTPTRHALRRGEHGALFVTNDFLALPSDPTAPGNRLVDTACSRRERLSELVHREWPRDAATCLRHLDDPGVRMDITMQQMVFEAKSGRHWLRRD